ncbi:MAG TPA: kelch repeat-containing protein [Phycisphaerae bacterium]|nr:kelch repeat-containing protein [Phycisphaerae bacterium]
MAYDSARGRTVLYGDNTETWEWDGNVWAQVQVPGLEPRGAHAMAYDAVHGEVVLFGGNYYDQNSQNQFPASTWVYNGAQWIQRATTGPPPRASLAMAFDELRARVVLFGGVFTQNGTQFYGDTWEWDGQNWEQRSSTGPSPRYAHEMAYDVGCNRVVLFGGTNDGASVLNDIWEWDGAIWTRRSAEGPPRGDFAMTYDSARGNMVLFGGIDEAGIYRSDTWAYECARLGDMNRDGSVDGLDIQAFTDVVLSGSVDPAAIYLADFDVSGSITVADVEGFSNCLLNQP